MSGPCCARSGHRWVIVSTGMFTSFLFEPDFDVVNLSNRTLHALGSWDTRVTVTSPADIGRLTTAIYLHQPRIVNEVVFVAGETTSYRQLADTVERVTQQTFSKAVHTLPALLEQLRTNPDDAMLRYRAAFARGMACGGRWATLNARHQLPTQTLPAGCRPRADFLSQDRMTMNKLIPLIVLSCLLPWRQMPEPSPPPAIPRTTRRAKSASMPPARA